MILRRTGPELDAEHGGTDRPSIRTHPFSVGEQFTAEQYIRDGDSLRWNRVYVTYEIVKASSKTIQLKPIDGDGKAITRKPRKSYNGDWCFSIDDTHMNTFYKAAVVSEAG